MNISGSPAAYAYQGIQDGFNRLNNTSQQIATPNSPNLETNLVDLKQSETQVEASAKALKTADGMIGTLIDIMA